MNEDESMAHLPDNVNETLDELADGLVSPWHDLVDQLIDPVDPANQPEGAATRVGTTF